MVPYKERKGVLLVAAPAAIFPFVRLMSKSSPGLHHFLFALHAAISLLKLCSLSSQGRATADWWRSSTFLQRCLNLTSSSPPLSASHYTITNYS
jgi:hypothetical protein